MSDLISRLYRNNDFEESQLRSILLFGEFGKTHHRTDMLPKAVLSIIIQEKGNATIEGIIKQFGPCYSYDTNSHEIEEAIKKLIDSQLVKPVGDDKYAAITEVDKHKSDAFFADLDQRTDRLIDSIIARYEELRKCKAQNRELLRKNITKALSLYLKLSGVNAVMSDSDNDLQPVTHSLDCITDKMDNVSAKILIDAIGQIISQPSTEDLKTLNIWARAYVLTQVMKIDPTLADFKATKIRDKVFVLDTDVVLNLLATHAKYSQSYRTILKTLSDVGCKIIIPNEVIKDVDGHVKQAINRFNEIGQQQIDSFPEYIIEGPKSNVFIEDYVKLRRSDSTKRKMNFLTYIGNIYNDQNPNVLKGRLEPIIGQNVNNALEVIDIDTPEYSELKSRLTERAAETAKGSERKLNTNLSLSEDDARLFFTLTKKNEEILEQNQGHGKGLLQYKYYFLTQMRRTVLVAKELGIYKYDIICHPQALGSVLSEIGNIPQGEISIVNLFENPFLALTAATVWDKIQPIIEQGAQISFMEIQQLRSDVDQTFDELLLSNDPQERINLAREYRAKGYPFMEQLVELAEKNETLAKENETLRKENSGLTERLNNAKKKNHYLQKMNKQSRNKKHKKK